MSHFKKNIFNIFYPFLAFFSTLASTQTVKDICLIYFQRAYLEKLGYTLRNFLLTTIISTLYQFSKAFFIGRGVGRFPLPRPYIDSDPPARVKLSLLLTIHPYKLEGQSSLINDTMAWISYFYSYLVINLFELVAFFQN